MRVCDRCLSAIQKVKTPCWACKVEPTVAQTEECKICNGTGAVSVLVCKCYQTEDLLKEVNT